MSNVKLPQGEVGFGTARETVKTAELLNELHLIWEHLGLLSDLQSHIIAPINIYYNSTGQIRCFTSEGHYHHFRP